MIRDALIVYGKEILVMRRDRRLTIGVTVTSLIVMPALMGFLGRVTTGGSNATASRTVVITNVDNEFLDRILDQNPTFIRLGPTQGDAYPEHITVSGNAEALLIQTDRTKPVLWEAALQLELELNEAKARVTRDRLIGLGVSPEDLEPLSVDVIDTSSANSKGAVLFGALVPYLVIVLLVGNSIRAVYVAVGEKEKNTLASLLVSQVSRKAVVLGKSLAISTFAVLASTLLIIGMVLFTNLGFSIAGSELGSVAFSLNASQILQLMANIGGLALVLSAAIMTVGTYARTQREAGVYTAPLLFLSIFLAIFSFSDASFPLGSYAVPILGNAVAMKSTIVDGTSLPELALVLLVNGMVFATLVGVSVAMYHREGILFRR